MNEPVVRYESNQEPLDDEERELMDPNTWDWENAYEVNPSPDPHLVFEVRLAGVDLKHIERAAFAEGMTVTAYLLHSALRCALQHASSSTTGAGCGRRSRAPASHKATASFPMAAASSRVDPCVWSRGMSGTLTTKASSSADHSITRA